MSTRANIHFKGSFELANVYIHSDGYPDGEHGIPARLKTFFAKVAAQTGDTRFNDPSMLAARFVVDQSHLYTQDKSKPLDFLSVRVMTKDAGDAAYIYTVNCDKYDAKGCPVVTYKTAR